MTRLRPLLLTLALLAGGLLATGAAAPATAAGALATNYTCSAAGQTARTDVAIRTALPASVKKGRKVAAAGVTVGIALSEPVVAYLREYDVRALSGVARNLSVRVGGTAVKLAKLTIPRTPLPETGGMTLVGKGKLASFTPAKKGSFPVKVPARLDTRLTAHFDTSTMGLDFACAVTPGAPTRISTLKVT